ncbi:TldD/PmbA family protein [Chamaesiphon polymorphus]|uniref:Zn-dependent protease n=1 Tax=Chamaesiphon polymorphus CCALA 037 TaxID=2107692 RepID=A0A2T1GKZ8_9CYAN|nr:TldD/PmbA family protein [Chamaesiphon polymorphus]PSB58520.1 Zn-dependent protease [Chamaesiphon polymorphus CCALA 037]
MSTATISQLSDLLQSIDLSVEWLGLRKVREVSTGRSARDGMPQNNSTTISEGVMVEVLVDGQIGYGATNILTPAGVRAAAQAAFDRARTASKYRIYTVTTAQRPKVVGQYVSPTLQPFNTLTPGEISEQLSKICHTLKVSDKIVQTSATIITRQIESWFVSSNGSDVYQKFLLMTTDYAATAQDGAIIQHRSDRGGLARCYQGGMEYFLTPDLWARVQQVGEQAVELLTAMECPTETTTLVLAPDQLLLQIHESVGHPLELDRILGDERNYAGGSFVQPSDFGNLVYGSPLMNITFDPTVAGEFASYSFDDTGASATREYIIRDGILERGLGSLESQARLDLPGVACSRACSWNRPPIDRMANINLEPGEQSFDEIIGGIERGIYMESNRSWSIDDRRHKFQFSCEYAKLIENGKLTQTVRNPNYRGITPQFWGNLDRVGNANTWEMYGSPFCGKGEPNQIVWVGHGAPVAAFTNIEIFGGD